MAVALSGLAANTAWLNASASNIANANDQSAIPPSPATAAPVSYQPIAVAFSTAPGGGVAAQVTPVTPAYNAIYDPSSPSANAQGVVGLANVDLASQMVNMAEATFAYRANLAVFKAAAEMEQTTLDMLA